jgi:uncharacterized protein (UPF0332 family)
VTFSERLYRAGLIQILAEPSTNTDYQDVVLRRAISSLYYGLFHRINEDAAGLIAPNVSAATNHRIQRWFEHTTMKQICGRFLKEHLEQPLLSLVGTTASEDLQTVCRAFIELQEARHAADYDPDFDVDQPRARQYGSSAMEAIRAWNRISQTSEANIFILSLLLWKNWEKDR